MRVGPSGTNRIGPDFDEPLEEFAEYERRALDRLLVDSHVLLWFVEGNRRRISPAMWAQIEAVAATVSIPSLWEIAIKSGLGRLRAPDDLPERVEQLGFELLAVTPEHAWHVRSLPLHHRDPFDRLLIAQAQRERLSIVTANSAFDAYDVDRIWD